MASGFTTTGSLSESLPTVLAAARVVREYEGIMSQLCDKVELGEGNGLTWNELTYAKLTAVAINENTIEDNYQEFSDSLLSATPTMVSIATLITDRVARTITKIGYVKLGQLPQNAIQRKKDLDGLTVLDGATTSLGGAGTTATSGLIAAAGTRIDNNSDLKCSVIHAVLHGNQVKDFYDELVSGVGTYVVTEGPTARVFSTGFTLPICNVKVYKDMNITVDSSDDAKGGVFGKEGIVLVQGKSPWNDTEKKPGIGGGSTVVYHRDEYVYVERSAGNALYEIYTDATNPTS